MGLLLIGAVAALVFASTLATVLPLTTTATLTVGVVIVAVGLMRPALRLSGRLVAAGLPATGPWTPAGTRLEGGTATTDERALVRHELQRCRRYEHPLGVVRLTWRAEQPWLTEPISAPPLQAELEGTVTRLLRESDLHLRADGHLYLILPESPRSACEHLVERLLREQPTLALLDIRVAAFPEDGLTLEGVLDVLECAPSADEERRA